jgi:type III secretion system YopN/LcrE/InvE/MxiC family regulator
MDQRIEATGFTPASRSETEGQDVQQAGMFMGDKVQVEEDMESLIRDAAEELTFSVEEEAERKLSERKEEKKEEYISSVLFYLQQCGDMERNDLEEMLKQIAALKGSRNADILALVRRTFTDPTTRHAALSYARSELSRLDLPEQEKAALREDLTEALRQLEAEDGPAIRAGYNIAGVPPPDLGLAPSSLRTLYRDVVIDYDTYEKTFLHLLDKFGPADFPRAVRYVLQALGSDMNAITPSSPPAALKQVLDGLYMVQSLDSVYSAARDLLEAVARRHGQHPFTEQSLIRPLLSYTSMPALLPAQVTGDMPFLVTDNAARDAELTQGLRELARKMPHKLYLSNEVRQNVLNALQELLDTAADREEAALEA